MKHLRHPGAVSPRRFEFAEAHLLASVCLRLRPGEDLFAAVHLALDDAGAEAGCFKVQGGGFRRLTLMTGGAGQDGAPVGFRGPFSRPGPLRAVAGAGVSGRDGDGARFTHCHAVVEDADGVRFGGHFLPGEAPAGAEGLNLALTPIQGAVMLRREDPETRFLLFHPAAA